MKLPKLYSIKKVKFWTLRLDVGENLGLEEVDKLVELKAKRVIDKDGGIIWQIVDKKPHCKSLDNISINEQDSIVSIGETK
tara:strand:- start:262 stop:504 length:243 start_codon:yes stop_codon:yes gene_type:complete